MTSDRSNRAAFLKAAGLSLAAVPALAGMAAPIGVRSIRLPGPDNNRNIPEKLARISDLTTLSAYINNDSALYPLLEGSGPYTLFAPSNEAFAQLPSSVQRRLARDSAYLEGIVQHHILSGEYKRSQLMTGTYQPLSGPPIRVEQEGAETHVNHGIILRPNVGAMNGVIHIISKVLVYHV